ncbi:hypothetical protein ZOD2009_09945 [Haladaptatus paucihalophilus DX253]|uniref:Uncharacterized protein n=1 Tax=Haladaptatus paucihalophilus DX253 TaxID=797209 RepID=E7QSY1_HALPU|nr:hypothetical protein ZOD2009_09945 [Haladaptatus paucihalophilus DX253]
MQNIHDTKHLVLFSVDSDELVALENQPIMVGRKFDECTTLEFSRFNEFSRCLGG